MGSRSIVVGNLFTYWGSTEHGTTNSWNLEVGVSHDQIPQKRLVFHMRYDELRKEFLISSTL